MDNHEDYLDALTAYARAPTPEIPSILERYLNGVAKNGETLFQWPLLKPLIVGKMEQVIQELAQGLEAENIPTRPNVENVRFEVMHARIMDAVHKFTGAPFTIQRLCELLLEPKRHYKRSDKFMRGLEKNVLVVSTVDPFGRKVVSESSHKHLVNGMDGSSSPLLPRDPHNSIPLPPVPDWVTSSTAANGADGLGTGQVSGISSNGVAGGLVGSVYTDQGEQPMAVQSEEVIEETVVTMDTNEVTTVTDAGEAMAEVEEGELGGEDTNASSSSSSSSSSEELSVSDSSEGSSGATTSTRLSSSSETFKQSQPQSSPPAAERPWACLTDPSTTPDNPWPQSNNPPHTSPSSDGEGMEAEAPLSWHPVAEPSNGSATSAVVTSSPPSSTSPRHNTESSRNDSFGFEGVTTSTECSLVEGVVVESSVQSSELAVALEDSGGVDTSSEQVIGPVAESSADYSSLNPTVATTTEVITSSSTSLDSGRILSPSAMGYPECDSVAGLERLVSSVDASSPIAVLSSSSPLDPPLPTQTEIEVGESRDEPAVKKSKLENQEKDSETVEDSPVSADSSSCSTSSPNKPPQDASTLSHTNDSSADITSTEVEENSEEVEEKSEEVEEKSEEAEMPSEEDKKENNSACEVSSPSSQLSSSSSSSDSTGFDTCVTTGEAESKEDKLSEGDGDKVVDDKKTEDKDVVPELEQTGGKATEETMEDEPNKKEEAMDEQND